MSCCLKFTLEETKLNFCIKNSTLQFNADLGYIYQKEIYYRQIIDPPQINYRTLESGNNTYEYLGVEPAITDITEQDIDNLIFGG